MDPEACLAEILEIMARFKHVIDKTDGDLEVVAAGESANPISRGEHMILANGILGSFNYNRESSSHETLGRQIHIRSVLSDDANRLVDLMDSLDGWLKGGGFLPGRWRP